MSVRPQVAIETGTAAPSVAARLGDRVESRLLDGGASTLLVALEACLEALGARGERSAEWVAVAQGPGSYTGLRAGLASAAVLAHLGRVSLVPVPSALMWACDLEHGWTEGTVCLDAGRDQAWIQSVRCGAGGLPELVGDPRLEHREDALALPGYLCGNLSWEAANEKAARQMPARAAFLLDLAPGLSAQAPDEVLPIYFRPSRWEPAESADGVD